MKIRRILTIVLALSMLVQNVGISAYASGVPAVTAKEAVADMELTELVPQESSEETDVLETVVEESTSEAESVSESETVLEGTADMEEETTIPETESEETLTTEQTVEEGDGIIGEIISEYENTYPLDTTLAVTFKDVKANPGSYHVGVSWTALLDYYGGFDAYSVQLIYTDDKELGTDFFSDVTYITSEDFGSSGYNSASQSDVSYEYLDNGEEGYEDGYIDCINYEINYVPYGLKQDTTYYFRLAQEVYDSSLNDYVYKFLSVPGSFTTKSKVETSKVTYKDIHVEKNGYGAAKLVWSVDNPDNEYVMPYNVLVKYWKGDNSDNPNTKYASVYQNENDNAIPGKFCAIIPLMSDETKVTFEHKIYTGDSKETPLVSEEITIERKDIEEASVTTNVVSASSSITAEAAIMPFHKIDDAYLNLRIFYREKDKEDSFNYVENDFTDGSATAIVSELLEGTVYEYYLQITDFANNVIWSNGDSNNFYTIETKEIITYTEKDFPDEVFLEAVKAAAGIEEGEAITSKKLEKILSLDCSRDTLDKEITSIEGIQYLVNLGYVDFMGQSITDASPIEKVSSLYSVYFGYNDLTEMPDLSKLTGLTYLDLEYNVIPSKSFTKDKLPAVFLANNPEWINSIKMWQREAFSCDIPDTFYAIGDRYPFFASLEGIKGSRDYTFSLTISGKTFTVEKYVYGSSADFLIPNLLEDENGNATGLEIQRGEYTATISLSDDTGKEYLKNETIMFHVEDDIAVINSEQYIENGETDLWIYAYIPGRISDGDIKTVELYDKAGMVMGKGRATIDYYNDYDSRYDDFYCYELDCYMTQVELRIQMAKYLTGGDYDIKVTLKDGTVYTMNDVVHVTKTPVVTNVYYADEYDNYGDYLHVYVYGHNLDKEKLYPVIYLNGEAITGEVVTVQQVYSSGYLYKLKKINKESVWMESFKEDCTYKLVAADGYSFVNKCTDDEIYINIDEFVLFEHYNYKKKAYEVILSGAIPEGTEVDVTICTSSSYTGVEATATAKVKNGRLLLSFVNEAGNAYEPPMNVYKYFKYDYEVNGEVFSVTDQKRIEWLNYYSSGSSDSAYIYRDTVLYQESGIKELAIASRIPKELINTNKELMAYIYTDDGTMVGNAVILSKNSITIGGKAYINSEGTWKNETGLEEGIYSIIYVQDNVTVTADTLYVYDKNTFYMNDQYISTSSDGTRSLCFVSDNLAGEFIHKYNKNVSDEKALSIWNEDYNLEIFDANGNKITGWKVNSASIWTHTMQLCISGLPDGYTGFYYRITDKNGNLGELLGDGRVYYEKDENSSAEYGKWHSMSSRTFYTYADYSELHAIYGIGTFYQDMYPATVTFTRPCDPTVIKTIKVNSNNIEYVFTASDLEGINSNDIYEIYIKAATGEASNSTGYFAVKGSSGGIVNATGITLDKNTLNLQLEETAQLKATVKPNNATNSTVTWESSDTTVATVDNTGKVTAVGAGTAVITARTHNNKTAKCTVNVYSYSISKTTLSLDLSSENSSEILTISNGIENVTDVTWTSFDSSVAKVDKNGKVTATGVGETVIEAVVTNGPTFICDVTVQRSILEKIILSESSIEMDKGMSHTLHVFYIPDDVTCTKDIIWTSSDDKVVTVSQNGVVNAVSNGEAIITATVKDTEITAQCTVKVFDTVDEEQLVVPSNLTALTNVDKTLGDVSLDAFEGWSWREEDKLIELSRFSGDNEKLFVACYQKDENTKPIYRAVPIKLSTLAGISVAADNSTVLAGESTDVCLTWNITGASYDMSAYEDGIVWKVQKPAFATVSGNGVQASVNAIAKGKTNVEVTVEINGKVYTAKTGISVLEGKKAQIQVESVSGMTETAEGSGIYTGSKADITGGTVKVVLTDADTLTVNSNNAKVVSVKKVSKNSDGSFTVPYTVKAAGTAKITLTANDSLKTSKEILLQVKDTTPTLSTTSIKVNRLYEGGTSVAVYEAIDAVIKNVELAGDGSDYFTCSYADGIVNIVTVNETVPVGKYANLALKVTFTDESISEWSQAFTVNVEEKKPTFTAKQDKKLNLFMNNTSEKAQLLVTASDNVKSISLDEKCDIKLEKIDGVYYLSAKENNLSKQCVKKGILTVEYENYRGEYNYSYTVGLEDKVPKITTEMKSYTLYPSVGIYKAKVKLYSNKEVFNLEGHTVSLEDNENYSCEVVGNEIILTRSNKIFPPKEKVNVWIGNSNWTEAVKVQVSISMNTKKPQVKLSNATIQLNPKMSSYDAAALKVMWNNSAAFDPYRITVSAANAASQAVLNKNICFTIVGDTVVAKLNTDVAADASYKFKVNVIPNEGEKEISKEFTVKVVSKEMDSAVKLSVKGDIDVLNRDSYATITPTIKGLNGVIKEVKLSGGFAELFEASVIDNGKIRIFAKDDANLITKYKYLVDIRLTLVNEMGETVELPAVTAKIKCKQGNAKITVTPKNGAFYSNSYNRQVVDIAATLKGAANPTITDVELLNETNAFVSSYDPVTNKITITMKNNGEAVKGKNYNLQFKVTLAGQADNEKAMVVKYKATIK